MKRFGAAASILFALGSVGLAGCEDIPWHFDQLSVNGRDGGGALLAVPYPALMRLGAAAHLGFERRQPFAQVGVLRLQSAQLVIEGQFLAVVLVVQLLQLRPQPLLFAHQLRAAFLDLVLA